MIKLTPEIQKYVNNALSDGFPMILCSVDEDNKPSLTYYGSTQVHRNDELAIWVRNPNSGTLNRIANNQNVALLYRNIPEHLGWQFHGRAIIVTDPEVALNIYNNSPKLERDRDPEMLGKALIIELDSVTGRNVEMKR
ncbi:MAG: hypothetical protein CL792_05650 [Chloroflexi bacterium]|nr:hypothetical protein [Chloroflexota bacterium]|tara:strand:- start:10457 stop:10870 length:414 start_codon:yes stop_codon:yes gene_type:complete